MDEFCLERREKSMQVICNRAESRTGKLLSSATRSDCFNLLFPRDEILLAYRKRINLRLNRIGMPEASDEEVMEVLTARGESLAL